MFSVTFSEESQVDIEESSEYYIEVSENLNERFLIEIESTIVRIQENPTLHQIRYRNIRIAFTQIFPFGIHFILEERKIFIIRILHTQRFFK